MLASLYNPSHIFFWLYISIEYAVFSILHIRWHHVLLSSVTDTNIGVATDFIYIWYATDENSLTETCMSATLCFVYCAQAISFPAPESVVHISYERTNCQDPISSKDVWARTVKESHLHNWSVCSTLEVLLQCCRWVQ